MFKYTSIKVVMLNGNIYENDTTRKAQVLISFFFFSKDISSYRIQLELYKSVTFKLSWGILTFKKVLLIDRLSGDLSDLLCPQLIWRHIVFHADPVGIGRCVSVLVEGDVAFCPSSTS